jgi:NADH pyrophosphatase NudC (nudix superfamily)
MHLDPQIAILIASTCGAGYLMTVAGLGKSLLELRRTSRICPSCGKHLRARVCPACTSS